ncbi:hypothetical protein ACX9GQ_03850 [Alsobacter sp. R-9]
MWKAVLDYRAGAPGASATSNEDYPMNAKQRHQTDLEKAFLHAARMIERLDDAFGEIKFIGHYARVPRKRRERDDEAFRGEGGPLDVLRSRLEDLVFDFGRGDRHAVVKAMTLLTANRRRLAELRARGFIAPSPPPPAPDSLPLPPNVALPQGPAKPLPAIWQDHVAPEGRPA